MKFILASASPRRKDLLGAFSAEWVVQPANIDESILVAEHPEDYVKRMASKKVLNVFDKLASEDTMVLAADTIVVLDTEILCKPKTRNEAISMLTKLAGRSHFVVTAFAIFSVSHGNVFSSAQSVKTEVTFRRLGAAEVAAYVDTGEPMDKAGSYAIQGLAANFVSSIHGSYTNVVGLPLAEVYESMKKHHGVALYLKSGHSHRL